MVAVAALAIVASVIAFETAPSADARVGIVCNNCDYEMSEKSSYIDKLTDPITILTLILAVSTVALWRSTEKLASMASIQSLDMKESIVHAGRSAEAALKAASIAEDSMIKGQRAFVFVDQFSLTSPDEPRLPEAFHLFNVRWKNAGLTPARNCVAYLNWLAPLAEIGSDFDFPDLPGGTPPTRFYLGQDGTAGGEGRKIDTWIIREVMRKERKLYVWGWCEYNDIFEKSARHRTEFCASLDVINSGEGSAHAAFAFYNRHNGIDDECMKPVHT